jgi:16S rRNA (cytidine1402-2'-O)-methyltransferase
MVGARAASLGLEMEPRNRERAAYPPVGTAGEALSDHSPRPSDGDEAGRPAGSQSPGSSGGRRASVTGTLTIAAVPIGQPADASARLHTALSEATLIAAEDTRRVRRLAAALGVQLTGRLVSNYDEVESRRAPALVAELLAGQDVLLVTDAGMPGVSDPGYRLVAAAAEAGVRVTVLPGPSAVTSALVISGLPCDRFVFEGFPPRRAGERARRFAELAADRRTLVLFESPRRLAATLAELAQAFGPDRMAAVCRELTKTHEEVVRGTLAELAGWAMAGVLGEITVVIAGTRGPSDPVPIEEAVRQVAAQVQAGQPRKEAIAAVARALGLPRREVYNAVVAGRPE